MNDKWLKSFLAIAETGSITSAARELYITPQALLQQLNLLESAAGFKLFHRNSTGCTLTPSGNIFYKGTLQIFQTYSQTIAQCRRIEESNASIRIPFMLTIVPMEFMEKVCASYKSTDGALKVQFIPARTKTDDWIDGLVRDEYDIIEHYCIDGYVPRGVYFQKLYDIRSWCLMRSDHPLANKAMIGPEELEGSTLATNCISLLRYLQMYLENTGIHVDFREIESNRFSIIDACDAGDICFLNGNIANEFTGFSCVPLNFDTHVQSDLACRETMYPAYVPFFDAAIEVSKTFSWGE